MRRTCCSSELDGGDARLKTFAEAAARATDAPPTATTKRRRARWCAIWCWRLQAALLIKHAPPAVADAFCASRLDGEGGGAFGTLPRGARSARDRERAAPLN